MTDIHLPEGYGTLGLDFQLNDWRTETNLHSSELYQQRLYELRQNSDNMFCYFCGFPDGRFLEIHHLDGNHTNYERSNLRACCSMCHRVNHLGWIGIKAHGKLVQLPSNIHVEEDERIPVSLEIFNLVQRFYLMSSYLNLNQQTKLESLPLKNSINTLLNAFKRRNYEFSYHEIKKANAEKAEERVKLQAMNKEQKDRYFTEKLELTKKTDINQDEEVSFLSGGLYIVDLVDALCKEHSNYIKAPKNQKPKESPSISFFKQQRTGENGRLAVWFNTGVFEPFSFDDFTLSERMDYYNDMGIFSPEGIAEILHKNREKNSKLPDSHIVKNLNVVNTNISQRIINSDD